MAKTGPIKFDKMYVCKEDTSNKYWGYAKAVNTHSVDCWWGRLGTDGTITPKSFPDSWKLDRFIESKTNEKMNDSYKEVTPEEFELQMSIARELGVGSKIEEMRLVGGDGDVLKTLTTKELHQPGVKPKVYAKVVGRRSAGDDTIPVTEFLFDVNASYRIKCKYRSMHQPDIILVNKDLIEAGDDYEKLASAVGSVIGKVLL
jgi:predicted DNA-binding WGR domain protein